MVPKYLDEARKQVDTLILDISRLEYALSLIIEEVVIVNVVLSLVRILNYHVAGDIHQERVDALAHYLLDVGSLNKRRQ